VPTVSARPVSSARPRQVTSKPWQDPTAAAQAICNRLATTLPATTTTEAEADQSRIGAWHRIATTIRSRHARDDRNDREHRGTSNPNTTQPIAAVVHFFPTTAATGIHSQAELTPKTSEDAAAASRPGTTHQKAQTASNDLSKSSSQQDRCDQGHQHSRPALQPNNRDPTSSGRWSRHSPSASRARDNINASQLGTSHHQLPPLAVWRQRCSQQDTSAPS